jgi:signal transduction histidine kinase
VNDAIELLRGEIRNKRIVLRLATADGLPPTTGDGVQQVVLNRLLNAVEATHGINDRRPQMLVRIERDDGDRVRLAVTVK